MKNINLITSLLIALVLLPLSFGCSQERQDARTGSEMTSAEAGSPSSEDSDTPLAARVNGSGIPLSELETAVMSVLIQNGMDASHTTAFMGQFGPRVLDQLIQGELLFQEAQKNDFKADPEEIDSAFSEISGRYESLEQFLSEIAARGFTEDTLKGNMQKQITIQKYIEGTIVPEAKVAEETVRAAYDQNPQNFVRPEEIKASHILFKLAESDSQERKDEALQKANEIASLARQDGADFAALAREYSEGPSAPSGGDLGFFSSGRMVKPFEEKAFSMEVGEISDPVLTQFGYHIIKLTDHRESSTVSFDEVREKLATDLKNRLVNELINRKIDEMKQTAEIEILFKPNSVDAQQP